VDSSFSGARAKLGVVAVNKHSALNRKPSNGGHRADNAGGFFNLRNKILQAEREQKADKARIDDAITRVESAIAALEQRHLDPEEYQRAIITIRDRAILTIRDVRKNMVTRTIAARNMQNTVNNEFLRQRSRFAADDLADANLRTRFFEILENTPTFTLIHHLLKAVELGNTAYAESIRFEFQCRDDRHKYLASFEMILSKMALYDPVELRKRLTNICTAAENVDTRVTDLLRRTTNVGRHEGAKAGNAVPPRTVAVHPIAVFVSH